MRSAPSTGIYQLVLRVAKTALVLFWLTAHNFPAAEARDAIPSITTDVVWQGTTPQQVSYNVYGQYLKVHGYYTSNTSPQTIFLETETDLYEKALLGDEDAAIIYAMGAMGDFRFEQSPRLAHGDSYQQRALGLLEPFAERAHPPAYTLLSLYYRYGLGTQPNPAAGDAYFKKALAAGDLAALNYHAFQLLSEGRTQDLLDTADRLIRLGDSTGHMYIALAYEREQLEADFDSAEVNTFFDKALSCWQLARIDICGFLVGKTSGRQRNSGDQREATLLTLLRLANKEPQDYPSQFHSIDSPMGLGVRVQTLAQALRWKYLYGKGQGGDRLYPKLRDTVLELEPYFDSMPKAFRPDFAVAFSRVQSKNLWSDSDGTFESIQANWETQTTQQIELQLKAARYINQVAEELQSQSSGRAIEAQVFTEAALNHSQGLSTVPDVDKAATFAGLAATYNLPAAPELKLLQSVFLGETKPSDALKSCTWLCLAFQIYADIEAEHERLLAVLAQREAEALAEEERLERIAVAQAEKRRQIALAEQEQRRQEAILRQEAKARQEQRIALERERQRRREQVSSFLGFAVDLLAVVAVAGLIVYTAGAVAPLLAESGSGASYGSYSSTYPSIPSACVSDFDCGVGNTCVKKQYAAGGICMKTVTSTGRQVLNPANPNSIRVGGSVTRCYSPTQCSAGFMCDLDYNVCVR